MQSELLCFVFYRIVPRFSLTLVSAGWYYDRLIVVAIHFQLLTTVTRLVLNVELLLKVPYFKSVRTFVITWLESCLDSIKHDTNESNNLRSQSREGKPYKCGYSSNIVIILESKLIKLSKWNLSFCGYSVVFCKPFYIF